MKMMWMFKMKIYPKQIQLVTSNPVGRKRMEHILKENFYFTFDNLNWKMK